MLGLSSTIKLWVFKVLVVLKMGLYLSKRTMTLRWEHRRVRQARLMVRLRSLILTHLQGNEHPELVQLGFQLLSLRFHQSLHHLSVS